MPEADAKLQGGAVTRGPVARAATGWSRRSSRCATSRRAQLVNVLRPLITPNNTIAAFPGSNALIITDYADNLQRIDRIIASLDQPPGGEPVLVPVKHASALDLVPMLNRLLGRRGRRRRAGARRRAAARDRSSPTRARTASWCAPTTRAAPRASRQLIEQLDTPGRAGGNMFIVYLKNAEAARVAQTLRALLTGGGRATPAAAPSSLAPAAVDRTARRRRGRRGAAPRRRRRAAAAAVPPPAPAAAFSAGGATIQADTANNALIIMAPEPVYNNLRAIIEKLDVRRAQVFVEALIVEVAADKAAEFGIQWQVLSGLQHDADAQCIGGTNFGARGSGNNIIDVAVNPGSARAGPQPRRHQRHGHHSRARHDHQPRVPRARARDSRPTPTSCRRRRC